MRNFFIGLIVTLAVALAIFLVGRLVVGSYSVVSQSMEPGIQLGQRLLVYKMAYNYSDPDRGDVVYYTSPEDNLDQLKRIIGLPGDVVEVKNSTVYVNGIKLTEPYVKSPPAYSLGSYQVPPNNYFVLGDNRTNSNDSSAGWTVPRENIRGRAWIYTWPPDKWGLADNYPLDSEMTTAEAP
jgi:signal peptidase I